MIELRVIGCRPSAQNTAWCERIESVGSAQQVDGVSWRALPVPLLEIVPVTDAVADRAIQTQVLDLDNYQKILFVSQNAVEHFFLRLEDFWLQLPQNLCLIGVGEKTKQAIEHQLDRWGATGTETVMGGSEAMNSEALLGMACLGEVSGEKILICRGQGGRPMLGEELEKRGASVDYCELYQRAIPALALGKMSQIFLDTSTDVLPLFSGETLSNLVQVLAKMENALAAAPFRLPAKWRELVLVVPGERVAQHAQAIGFKRVFIANNATEREMLVTLEKAAAELAADKKELN